MFSVPDQIRAAGIRDMTVIVCRACEESDRRLVLHDPRGNESCITAQTGRIDKELGRTERTLPESITSYISVVTTCRYEDSRTESVAAPRLLHSGVGIPTPVPTRWPRAVNGPVRSEVVPDSSTVSIV